MATDDLGLTWECEGCGLVLDAGTDKPTRRAISHHINSCKQFNELQQQKTQRLADEGRNLALFEFSDQLTRNNNFTREQAHDLFDAIIYLTNRGGL